jgi:predicted lipoprotein with Yx(FWY)xxD motif
LGQILTDGNGMTLYVFAKDAPGVSNCTGGCLAAWPALTVPAGTTPTAGSGAAGTLGTITRSDNGELQVTYDNKPLYRFGSDTAAGEASGEGVAGV